MFTGNIVKFVSTWAVIIGVALGKSFNRSFRLEKWLNELEDNGYDHAIPPGLLEERTRVHLGKTTDVQAEFHVESLGHFQPISMDYDIDIYFAEEWRDQRLKHNQSDRLAFNNRKHLDRLWQPDVYFANSKKARYNEVTVPNLIFWIWPDGKIRMNVRINMRVSCHMNLRPYPLDIQECILKILPYGNNVTKVNLSWLTTDGHDPIQINRDIQDADLQLVHKQHQNCTNESVYYNSTYSCLKAVFFLRRTIGQSLLQVYAPTVAIVVISWISFWIDPSSLPGRTGLCVTTLLTLSTQAAGISFRLPPVGYAKALDVWLIVCLLFLFASLIEFTIVNMYTRRWQSSCVRGVRESTIRSPETKGKSELVKLTEENDNDSIPIRFPVDCGYEYRKRALYIDKVSRIVFPCLFGVFMVVYWTVYTLPRQEVPVSLYL